MLYNDFNTLVVSTATPPAPTPPSGSTCGTAHGVIGTFLCDSSTANGWLSALSFMVWRWMQAWWPLLVIAAVVALTAGAVLAVAVRRARRDAVTSARWVEIVPPASMPRDGAAALWHALAGLLHRTRRGGIAPRQLAVEFVADAEKVRAGMWVPPALEVEPVSDAIAHVWPGARVQVTEPPVWTVGPNRPRSRVKAGEIFPAGGPWVPLTDAGPRTRPVDAGDADPLRVTLARLARLGPGERACVQLIITPERATTARRGRASAWWARGLLLMLTWPLKALLAVVDLFLPGPSGASGPQVRPHGDRPEEDPATEARRKAVAVKQGHGPHLRVTLRVAYSGPGGRKAHRRAVGVLAGGFDLVAPLASLRTHATRHAGARLDGRRPARARHNFAATVAELAALWHLPDEPTQYGMTDTVTRIRPPGRDLPSRWVRHNPNPGSPDWGDDEEKDNRDDLAA
ncbi:hypothetical protein OG738_44040 [Amycolatopsis sp. NBC_01488]|uniref:hypothetical protein n=1 Tax=Amycolatopsis sp. NBC_01488 TaxID=2903563 RepID=UPI002E29F113|nr:hypothetical protein [Amycolatopsis sp. NBC_01488]